MLRTSTVDMIDRAMGALLGGALGDALGMPTQTFSADLIAATYGLVDRFLAPMPDHPVSRGLLTGTITDDTEQTLLLGGILASAQGGFDDRRWAAALLEWERDVKARGSYDLLGPSTKRAIDSIEAGLPAEEAGRSGDTNGAAMRIAPVGIMMPLEPLDALVGKVAETCRATHNTSIAIAAASAVAAAVSHGIAGGDWRAAADRAVAAARLSGSIGNWVAGGEIAARIEWARDLVRDKRPSDAVRAIVALIGTFMGAVLIILVQNALNQLHVSAYWQYVWTGVLTLLAVSFHALRSHDSRAEIRARASALLTGRKDKG